MRYAARRRSEGAVAVAGVSMFSLIYLGLLPGFYIVIRRWHSAWLIAGIMLITKSCDIGAYFTGRFLGKHKLIPWLSPGKTWEGFIGGILTSGIVAMGLSWLGTRTGVIGTWVNPEPGVREWEVFAYPWWFALCFGILAGIVGQLGDLTASLFKRDAGIKDSGSAIPGFGGVLDVVDSPLVVAPLAYWLLVLGRELAVPA